MTRSVSAFTTGRLSVEPWQASLENPTKRAALESALTALLTPAVLDHLPPSFQRVDPINAWIEARHAESLVCLITDRASGALSGLLILASNAAPPSLHLGYLLAESAWGQGLATELLQGLAEAMRTGPDLTLVAGVERSNPASARVLEKAGFVVEPAFSSEDTVVYARRVGESRNLCKKSAPGHP